jgi:hypothetical protein
MDFRIFVTFTVVAPLLLTTGRINAQPHVEHAYQACLEKASAAHDTAWAAECKRIAEKGRQNHDACISERFECQPATRAASLHARETCGVVARKVTPAENGAGLMPWISGFSIFAVILLDGEEAQAH